MPTNFPAPPVDRYPKGTPNNRQNPAIKAYADFPGISKTGRSYTSQYQNVLGTNYFPFVPAPVTDDTIEPVGTLPTHKRGRLSGWGEPPSISHTLDISKIQTALRAAERGETTLLFQIYRDMNWGSHVLAEESKRKMVVVGQPHSIKPWKKGVVADQRNADEISRMIDNCENWQEGLIHMMGAALDPVVVAEKIYAPSNDKGLRFRFKRFDAVSPFLFCFKLAYMASGGFTLPPSLATSPAPNAIPMQLNKPGDTVWDPDTWEPDLRFFRTFPNGFPDYSWANIYAPDPVRHLVHRGNLLDKTIRDNYGGPRRAILFWWFLSTLGRDWFSRAIERHGSPFPVAYVDAQQVDTVNFLTEAFQKCSVIGGLLVDKRAKVEMIQAVATNMAQAHKIFLDFCNDEISKVILGKGTAASKKGGLNEGESQQERQVSEDYRKFDECAMSETLRSQLFTPYLQMNGFLDGNAPRVSWGGTSEEETLSILQSVQAASTAGLEPTDDGLEQINDRTGIEYQRKAIPDANTPNGKPQPAKPAKG